MNNDIKVLLSKAIKAAVDKYPAVIPFLGNRARYLIAVPRAYKTYDYYLSELTRMVKNLYAGFIGGEFIDIMASLIYGQLLQAYRQAWEEEGTGGEMPPYLVQSHEAMYLRQFDFVDQFYRDIVDARIDKTPIDPLLARCPLWANRWNEAHDEAIHLITMQNGGKEIWTLGATETHCPTCAALNGIVAYAREWDELGVRPQNAPNDLLSCGGWNCDCERKPTEQRRSPKAYNSIMGIVSR